MSQDLTVDGQVIVQPGGKMWVNGSVEITPNGIITNNSNASDTGFIYITSRTVHPSTWNCNGIYNGKGRVYFLGDTNAIIKGMNVTFDNLYINMIDDSTINTVELILEDSTTVDNNIELTNGLINADSAVLILNNPAIDALNGSFNIRNSNFITGKFQRNIIAQSYLFPIGSRNLRYNPMRLSFHSIPDTIITVEFVEKDTTGIIDVNFVTTDCYFNNSPQHIIFDRTIKHYGYWNAVVRQNNVWNYDFFCYPDIEHIYDFNPFISHLKVFKAPDSSVVNSNLDWSPFIYDSGELCDGVNVVPNTMYWRPGYLLPEQPTDSIRASNLNSFSHFALMSASAGGLPIELLSLKATPKETYIAVEWVTETEINNLGFEVQRSTDANSFFTVGWVNGSGNVSTTTYYRFNDIDVLPNQLYYYRLKQIDFDGASEFTYVVSAMIVDKRVSIFPNPTMDIVNVYGLEEFDLCNETGVTIQRYINTTRISLGHLPPGTYFIRTPNKTYKIIRIN